MGAGCTKTEPSQHDDQRDKADRDEKAAGDRLGGQEEKRRVDSNEGKEEEKDEGGQREGKDRVV